MDHVAVLREAPRAPKKPRITIVADFDSTMFLANNFAGILDAIDIDRLSDAHAYKLMRGFVNPNLFAAVEELRARFDIAGVCVLSAKKGTARDVTREGPPELLLNAPSFVSFREDTLDLYQRDYLAEQAPDVRPCVRDALRRIGLATWALGTMLGLPQAPPVYLTASSIKNPKFIQLYNGDDSRYFLFDGCGRTYARRLAPWLADAPLAEIVRETQVVPVPPYGFAQWNVDDAELVARWMHKHGIVATTPHPLFRDGRWRLAEAVREAQALHPDHRNQRWPVELVA